MNRRDVLRGVACLSAAIDVSPADTGTYIFTFVIDEPMRITSIRWVEFARSNASGADDEIALRRLFGERTFGKTDPPEAESSTGNPVAGAGIAAQLKHHQGICVFNPLELEH